jgi:hypothetical protein
LLPSVSGLLPTITNLLTYSNIMQISLRFWKTTG